MTALRTKNWTWIRTGRILLVGLGICGIAQNRASGNQNGIVQNNPVHCDTGVSRHSLTVASLNDVIEVSALSKSEAHRSPDSMVWIPGGRFWMGTNHMADAQPLHEVEVTGFWMDRTDVTNEEFARFVKATGYVTIAERPLDPKEFPTLAPRDLVPGSVVFTPPSGPVPLDDASAWWQFVKGANWRHPEGPKSDLRGKEKYPVVHIAWPDAVAYAK